MLTYVSEMILMSIKDYQIQIKRLRNLIKISKGSIDISTVINALELPNKEEFLKFLMIVGLDGLTIDWGIFFSYSSNSVIGGTETGEGNTIAWCSSRGILASENGKDG